MGGSAMGGSATAGETATGSTEPRGMPAEVGHADPLPVRARRWAVPFVGAVVVRLLYWALVTPHYVPAADDSQYVGIARSLADGKGFSLVFPQLTLHATAFRPPLYPALLTPGAWLFGDALWPARLLNVVLGSLVAVLAGVLAARIAGRRAGLAAAAIVALYPPLLANDTVALTEPLALALLLGAVLLLDDGRWAWSGLAAGALLLTRPNGYLVVLILAGWALVALGWRRAAGLAAVALAVLAPWMVRNHAQVGTWRPTTSDGFTISAVYGLPAQRAGHFIDPVFATDYDDADHRLAQFDEAGWNDKLTREGIDGAKEHPDYVWYMVRRNVGGYFELRPRYNHYPEDADGRRWGFRQATLPLFYLVTVSGVAGLWSVRRDRRVRVLALVVAQFVAVSLVLVAPPRLRAPFDLAMAIGAGILLAAWLDRRAARTGDAAPAPDQPSIS
jgi:4-amino-4-deoxy-L-arabinose transferase-like glycosyltransferase